MRDVSLPTWSDWLIVAGLLSVSWLSLFVAHDLFADEVATSLPRWGEHALAVAMLVPLAWRRQRPLTVLVLASVVALLYLAFRIPEGVGPTGAIFIALYAAGAYSTHPARDSLRGLAVAATLLLALYQVLSSQEFVGYDAALFAAHALAVNVAFFVAGWILGDFVRRHRADQRELQRRADQLATEQRERERRAVLDERVRIARELHDVVAHHVSVMGLQAGAARRVMDSDSARAAEALASVERSGREAIGELQRMVGFLRAAQGPDGGDERVAPPQPTLDDIDRLIETSPLPVQVHRVGRPRPLPASVELSAYRVIQEAITNTLKHAGPVPTTVVLTYSEQHLHVEIINERGTAPAGPPGTGRGLVGMRERARMHDGDFEHGPTSNGGYRVAASFPSSSREAVAGGTPA